MDKSIGKNEKQHLKVELECEGKPFKSRSIHL
jgi:hypothetical protein